MNPLNVEAPKEGFKVECPRKKCRSRGIKKVLYFNDGSDNIDNLPHYHLECPECGIQFLQWGCDKDKIKKAFGENWEQYW